jgi:enoyl-CoA hydratase/carnithine racemase
MSDMLQESRDGDVAILTLDYPQRRNALAMPMRSALIAAIDRLEGDQNLRAIVLTGSGGHFCAGGDISGMNSADFPSGRERFRITHRLVRGMIECAKPIIAAVEGWAVGAGLGLALGCDTIVAAEDAKFMAGFGKIGLVADFGLLHTLPKRIGEGRARQMFIHGIQVDAHRGEAIGLVDVLAPSGGALAKAVEMAHALSATAPIPIAMTKSYLAQGLGDALEWERNVQSTMFLTADHVEGRSAFMEKRKPAFTGR